MERVNSLIQKAENIAICTQAITDEDIANSIIALTKHLQNKGKAVGIIISKEPDADVVKLFKDYDVVYTTSASPLRYVVSIDYGKSKVEKVLHEVDEENNKVMFYIEPTGKDFDFDNVEYSQEGNSYDLTITIAIDSFQRMGEVYKIADYLFKENEVISIARGDKTLGDEFIPVSGNYTRTIKKVIGKTDDKDINELLSHALLEDIDIFEGNLKAESLEEIAEYTREGLDFSDLLVDKYYSKSYSNLDLQIKMMSNIRVDREARIIWSIVDRDDLKFAGVNRKSLDTKGRIMFNISSDFDLAFAAYEVESQLLKVVVESNDPEVYSAVDIASEFKGRGTDRHATFVMKDTPRKDFEKRLFELLKKFYLINVNSADVEFDTPQANENIQKDTPIDTGTSDSLHYDGIVDIPESTEIPLTQPIINGKNSGTFSDSINPVVIDSEEHDNTSETSKNTSEIDEYEDLLD